MSGHERLLFSRIFYCSQRNQQENTPQMCITRRPTPPPHATRPSIPTYTERRQDNFVAEPAGRPFAAIAFGPTPTSSVVAGWSVGYPWWRYRSVDRNLSLEHITLV